MRTKPAAPRLRPGGPADHLYAAYPLADRGNPTRDHVAGNGLKFVGVASWATGGAGPAVNGTGGAGYLISAGPIFDRAATDFTAAIWFLTRTTGVQTLIATAGGAGTNISWLDLNGGNAIRSSFAGTALLGPNVPVGSWHHAAISFSGGTLALYYDGVRVNSGARTVATNPGANLVVGASNNLAQCLNGMVDQVLLWTRALADAEVLALYRDPYRIWTPRRRWAATTAGGRRPVVPWHLFLNRSA